MRLDRPQSRSALRGNASRLAGRLLGLVRSVRFAGRRRFCPVCRRRSRLFLPHGKPSRPDARCPHCTAVERHRSLFIWIERHLHVKAGARVLHLAPEASLSARLGRRFGRSYVTADLSIPGADVVIDIQTIAARDETFDLIICSHVLEHVADDRLAMRELRRVLRSPGQAVILIPLTAPATFEDPAVTEPDERERLFGQHDHVRCYGPDVVQRLESAGFSVRVIHAEDLAGPGDVVRMSLDPTPFFVCQR